MRGKSRALGPRFYKQPYDLEQAKAQRPLEKGRKSTSFRLGRNHGTGQPTFNMLS